MSRAIQWCSAPGLMAAWLVVVLLGAFPELALACPVCFDASDENRLAFLATTAFLSLLPLGMVAGAGLWIRKRHREMDELESRSVGLSAADVKDGEAR